MQTLVVKKNLWVLKSLELLWRSCLALRKKEQQTERSHGLVKLPTVWNMKFL